MEAHDRAAFDMLKASSQPTAKTQPLEKLLYDYQSRIGGKSLILESDFRNAIDTPKNLCFTYFHLLWPPEKVALEWFTTSKTLSGGYLFVYPLSKNRNLCNSKVYIGKLEDKEIDFIGEKQNKKLYIQVAYLLSSKETIRREFSSFRKFEIITPNTSFLWIGFSGMILRE